MSEQQGTAATVIRVLKEAESLLKEPHGGAELGQCGVNTSIALLALQGVAAYVDGNPAQAADDLGTAAEEIRTRFERQH